MASLLGRGAAYLLQAAGPALLGKAGNFIMERGGEWL